MKRIYLFFCLCLSVLLWVSCNSQTQPEEPYYNELELTTLMSEYAPYIMRWLPYQAGDSVVLTDDTDTFCLHIHRVTDTIMVPVVESEYPDKDCDCVVFHHTVCCRTIAFTCADEQEAQLTLAIIGSKILPWDGRWRLIWNPAPGKGRYSTRFGMTDDADKSVSPAFADCFPLERDLAIETIIYQSLDSICITCDKGITRIVDKAGRNYTLSLPITE
ncbi:MAG: hypothetical protein NC038_06955 [Paludibacter sp.]|nr:hypothetical protein [Bacteroidales bacterium]MCM1069639.1 hypothetical protein [Prevotella sp.]MCM1354285.1 hypothetical protein [Bacteroides sp.]MCM1443124.1 hypothetical protein [Muribaculum sp.]MCM1482359.1 hypothetical protein [Paludibacter sp.]